LHYAFAPESGAPAVAPLMRLFNLLSDPKEETDIKDANPWVASMIDKIVTDFQSSTERYPHVPMNAKDPYMPPAAGPSKRQLESWTVLRKRELPQ
jgi:arylsulfatase